MGRCGPHPHLQIDFQRWVRHPLVLKNAFGEVDEAPQMDCRSTWYKIEPFLEKS